MSQSQETIALNIKAILTLDDEGTPQAVNVTGYGNMPRGAVRAIAAEALECHFGSVLHGYRVQMTPEFEGDEETEGTVFEIYKSIIGTRKSKPLEQWEINLLTNE